MEGVARRGRGQIAMRVSAEFVVIVIGVLVAFAVDDWANGRADRMAEVDYLRALVEDIRGDSAVWTDIHIDRMARTREILEATIPIARGDLPIPNDTASFLRAVSRSASRQFIQGSGPTYEELLATGSLRLIESVEVRSAIVDYYQTKSVAQLRSESGGSQLKDLVEGVLPQAIGGSDLFLGGSAGGEELVGSVFSVEAAIQTIVSTEAANAMGRHLNYVAYMASTMDTLFGRALELIQMLDREIESLT